MFLFVPGREKNRAIENLTHSANLFSELKNEREKKYSEKNYCK